MFIPLRGARRMAHMERALDRHERRMERAERRDMRRLAREERRAFFRIHPMARAMAFRRVDRIERRILRRQGIWLPPELTPFTAMLIFDSVVGEYRLAYEGDRPPCPPDRHQLVRCRDVHEVSFWMPDGRQILAFSDAFCRLCGQTFFIQPSEQPRMTMPPPTRSHHIMGGPPPPATARGSPSPYVHPSAPSAPPLQRVAPPDYPTNVVYDQGAYEGSPAPYAQPSAPFADPYIQDVPRR